MGLTAYLPGLALGLGIWSGLRWPFRAVCLLGALAVTATLAIVVVAGMAEEAEQLATNAVTLRWSVLPALAAFLVGQAGGAFLRARCGGGMG